jgi:hypothetical protein
MICLQYFQYIYIWYADIPVHHNIQHAHLPTEHSEWDTRRWNLEFTFVLQV